MANLPANKTDFDEVADAAFGPKMAALTERQRNYVIALLMAGDDNHTRAAAAAGYSQGSEIGLRVTAHRLAHDPKIIEAMKEEGDRRMNAASVMAISELCKIARNEMHKDQIKAISMILNRTGFHERTEHKVTVEHKSEPEQIERLKQFARILGLDAKQLLGAAGVVDAEFEDVTQEEHFDPTAGLEDLL